MRTAPPTATHTGFPTTVTPDGDVPVERWETNVPPSARTRWTAARRLYEERGYEQVGSETNPVTGDEMVRYRRRL